MKTAIHQAAVTTKDAVVAGTAGTTAFTLFSYAMAELLHKKYKEPKLLGKMINRLDTQINQEESQLSGWMLHYITGIFFALVYQQILNKTKWYPGIRNGLIAGLISAYPASLIWHTVLTTHPAPPRKSSIGYYIQLAIGHAIFGAVSFAVLRFLKNKRRLTGSSKRK